ncbi:hypothetical protein PX554_18250 [Sphingomonas sp. H39-1-10]|nr:hypothetical protein [Sphingomonas pollutisoli]MDF0490080.1 hypothetical protein [Sphingomonas pollutisoli]PJG45496.1 hypothetical protein CAF53_22415 [Sphingobium sp. LB126]
MRLDRSHHHEAGRATIREAAGSVVDVSKIRHFGFSHFESDECGALNDWLEATPDAVAFTCPLCCDELAIRTPAVLAKEAMLETESKRFRLIPSSHFRLAHDVVKGGLSISRLFDMAPFVHSWLQAALRLSGQEILNISPIRIVKACATPLIAAWGGAETTAFGNQSNNFLEAWAAMGNKGAPLEIPGKNHFDVLDGFETVDGTLTQALLSLASM